MTKKCHQEGVDLVTKRRVTKKCHKEGVDPANKWSNVSQRGRGPGEQVEQRVTKRAWTSCRTMPRRPGGCGLTTVLLGEQWSVCYAAWAPPTETIHGSDKEKGHKEVSQRGRGPGEQMEQRVTKRACTCSVNSSATSSVSQRGRGRPVEQCHKDPRSLWSDNNATR